MKEFENWNVEDDVYTRDASITPDIKLSCYVYNRDDKYNDWIGYIKEIIYIDGNEKSFSIYVALRGDAESVITDIDRRLDVIYHQLND